MLRLQPSQDPLECGLKFHSHRFRLKREQWAFAASAGLLLSVVASPSQGLAQQTELIKKSVPLYVRTISGAAMRVGAPVDGVLTRAVWVDTRMVLPEGAPVRGEVIALKPVPHEERLKALLGGDLTPLHTPVVDLETVQLAGMTVRLHADARVQQIELVRFIARRHVSLPRKMVLLARSKIHEEYAMVFGPHKKDRALRLLYSQLPYHPQRIWAGTELVGDLAESVQVAVPAAPEPARAPDSELASSLPPIATVEARLVTPLSSNTSTRGEPVLAVLTAPLVDARNRVLLTQGAQLEGVVQQVKPARSFGRTGTLRFSFRQVRRTANLSSQQLFGTLSGAGGSKQQNLKVDAEGKVQAQPQNNRFIAPLLLGALALHGQDDDGGAGAQVLAANGLGLVARVVAWVASSRNVATGFGAYGFAKSVYFRFIADGHAVTFPEDTPIEVQLNAR